MICWKLTKIWFNKGATLHSCFFWGGRRVGGGGVGGGGGGGGWRYFTHRNTIRCLHWKKKTFHWFSCIIFELWRKRSKQVLVNTKTKKLASSANTFIFWSGNIDYFNTYAFVVLIEWKKWSVCFSVIWDWKLSILFSNKGF